MEILCEARVGFDAFRFMLSVTAATAWQLIVRPIGQLGGRLDAYVTSS
jgi:hypothetical protein